MSNPTDLRELPMGSRIEESLLVLDVMVRTTNAGEPYTILTLGNSTGQMQTAPFWLDKQDAVAGISKGHVVQAIGEITTYRDQRQLSVSSISLLPKGAVDPASLLPSVGAVDRYWTILDGWRNEIAKPRLKGVLDLFFEEDNFRIQFETCPAAVRGHHAALGGLLKHTTEMAAIGRAIARACGADQDLVLAGVLLHDIGKLESYRWDTIFEYTQSGRLLGHVVLGAVMLDRRLNEQPTPQCTDAEREILLHLILSHHGQLELGSPVRPMILEAEVLHWADNASAKTASMADVLKEANNFLEGPISPTQWTLDRRRVYRYSTDWGMQEHDLMEK